ncbi:hypothetical protein [Winogradskyella sp.]|jgi:hypothetical protein|uniref:hypothetical protein n=1 Tax=Winogradskyella sp. TaxID=1883156 RepID=UPI0025F74DD9|nr:hypothetical protein [Winogradskyella sp.]MCT4628476.1 hypothetical protein [Winogradskyella sp.]
MRTNKYLLFILSITFIFNVSCNDELDVFKTAEGTLLSFRQTSYELSIPQEDITLTIPVSISNVSDTSRTFNVSILSATEGTANEYSIGSIIVPANANEGSLDIDFDFSEILGEDGDLKNLSVGISESDDASSYSDVVDITYFREIVCNDLTLTVISDVWASETYVTLEQADGTVLIDRFFPFGGNSTQPQTFTQDFNLPDGDYVLKIGDSYGDGMQGTGGGVTLTGSYSLTCSIITHASGEGTFDVAEADPFAGFPNATVEVTEFSVNP